MHFFFSVTFTQLSGFYLSSIFLLPGPRRDAIWRFVGWIFPRTSRNQQSNPENNNANVLINIISLKQKIMLPPKWGQCQCCLYKPFYCSVTSRGRKTIKSVFKIIAVLLWYYHYPFLIGQWKWLDCHWLLIRSWIEICKISWKMKRICCLEFMKESLQGICSGKVPLFSFLSGLSFQRV